jgi:hypothetical protein
MNFTNAGVIDYTATNNLWAASSSVAISTTQAKYGTSSIFFPGGTTGYIDCGAPLIPASGPFTAECWVYPTTTASNQSLICQYWANPTFHIYYSETVSTSFSADIGGLGVITSSGIYAPNNWYHVALTKNASNVYTLWVNGASVGTPFTSATALNTAGNTWIGNRSGLATPFTGYLDDVRITPGVVRYTTTFTPPTGALPTA